MEATTGIESGHLNDTLDLASWNRERSVKQLRSFVLAHDDALDVEDFDL